MQVLKIPRAALLLPTSGTQAPLPSQINVPSLRGIILNKGVCGDPGNLKGSMRTDISALLIQNKEKQLQSGEGHTRLSLGEAVVVLTEGPCAGKPPLPTLLPKPAWRRQPLAPTKASGRLQDVILGPTCPDWTSTLKVKITPEWRGCNWQCLQGLQIAPVPLHWSHRATAGSSTKTYTSRGPNPSHVRSLRGPSYRWQCSNLVGRSVRAASRCSASLRSPQPHGGQAALFRTLTAEIKPPPAQLPATGTSQRR